MTEIPPHLKDLERDTELLGGIWDVSLPISSEFQEWVAKGIWCQDGMCFGLDIKKAEPLGDWKVGERSTSGNNHLFFFLEEGCFNKTFIMVPCFSLVRCKEMPYSLLCFYLDSNPTLWL